MCRKKCNLLFFIYQKITPDLPVHTVKLLLVCSRIGRGIRTFSSLYIRFGDSILRQVDGHAGESIDYVLRSYRMLTKTASLKIV
jgi:hypothetical protein